MTERDRKGGGARRGPFMNKREPFATRLTAETMTALAKASDRSGLSISQKAEEIIQLGLRLEDALASLAEQEGVSVGQKADELVQLGLRAQNAYEREIAPSVAAFRERAIMEIIRAGGAAPSQDRPLADRLAKSAMELLGRPTDGGAITPSSHGSSRGTRILDVED